MPTAITRRWAAFAANKVVHIVALELLYALISVTKFSIVLANGRFSQSGSHIVLTSFFTQLFFLLQIFSMMCSLLSSYHSD